VQRRATIYDVAREAGVAASTVSRAYARPGRVNADTARLVFEAAERIGYRSARLEGTAWREVRSSRSIGLVISDVTNPFYGEIIKGAHQAAHDAGYTLIISHTSESPVIERETVEKELSQVAGVVIASSRMTDSALRMVAKRTPIVLLNRTIPEVSCVVTDNACGARRAVEHLAVLGHEQIVYVAGPETSWSDGVRWRSLRDTATRLGLDVRRVGPYQPTILAGFRASRRVVELGATAVIAYNDPIAIGVVKGVRGLGLRVPDDVSVIGFDNIIFDEIVEPALTTVAAPLHRMGHIGDHNCIAVANGGRPSAPPLVLPVRLVERASTGPRRRPTPRPERA